MRDSEGGEGAPETEAKVKLPPSAGEWPRGAPLLVSPGGRSVPRSRPAGDRSRRRDPRTTRGRPGPGIVPACCVETIQSQDV